MHSHDTRSGEKIILYLEDEGEARGIISWKDIGSAATAHFWRPFNRKQKKRHLKKIVALFFVICGIMQSENNIYYNFLQIE